MLKNFSSIFALLNQIPACSISIRFWGLYGFVKLLSKFSLWLFSAELTKQTWKSIHHISFLSTYFLTLYRVLHVDAESFFPWHMDNLTLLCVNTVCQQKFNMSNKTLGIIIVICGGVLLYSEQEYAWVVSAIAIGIGTGILFWKEK